MTLDVHIEALLFYKSTPQNKKKIIKLLGVSEEDFSSAISALHARLHNGAIRLIETDTEIQLSTSRDLAEFIESLRKQDLAGDIGKAGAETLAIIVYREPISRAEIDRIRGVNSSFIIRNLLMRGLIVREPTPGNSFQFRTSSELLMELGVAKKNELPKFSEFMNTIDSFDTSET